MITDLKSDVKLFIRPNPIGPCSGLSNEIFIFNFFQLGWTQNPDLLTKFPRNFDFFLNETGKGNKIVMLIRTEW